MELTIIYFAGVALLIVAYGVWFKVDDGCTPEELLGLAFIAVWIWPLTLPVVVLFRAGIKLGERIKRQPPATH